MTKPGWSNSSVYRV